MHRQRKERHVRRRARLLNSLERTIVVEAFEEAEGVGVVEVAEAVLDEATAGERVAEEVNASA
jgi:hypothetical protein